MEIPTEAALITAIEAFLARHGMAETTFGSLAKGENQFLAKLRAGRSPSLRVVGQVVAFMRERDAALHAATATAPAAVPSPGNDVGVSPCGEALHHA